MSIRFEFDLLHLSVLALERLRDERPIEPEPAPEPAAVVPPPVPAAPAPETSIEEGSPIPGLVQQLQDKSAKVRKQATKDLAKLGEPAALPVAALLADSRPRIRQAAMSTLQKMKKRAAPAAPVLAALLAAGDEELAYEAGEALSGLGPAGFEALAASARSPVASVRQAVLEFLTGFGEASREIFAGALRDPEVEVRVAAVHALQYSDDLDLAGFLPVLQSMLDDPAPNARAVACQAIAGCGEGGAPAIRRMLELLGDADPEVQRSAIHALGQVGRTDPAVAERLVVFLEAEVPEDDEDESIETAVWALAALRSTASAVLERLAHDPSPVRRARALLALGSMGEEMPRESLRTVLEALQDPAPAVRKAAVECLSGLLDAGDMARPAVMGILAAYGDADILVSETAQEALEYAWIDAEVLVSALLDVLAGATTESHRQAIQKHLLERAGEEPALLRTALSRPEPAVRRAVCLALWQAGVEVDDAAGLIAAAKDADRSVAIAATLALRSSFSMELAAAVTGADPIAATAAAIAMGGIREAASDVAAALLTVAGRTADPFLREAAVDSVGRRISAGVEVPPAFADWLSDPSPRVRSAALMPLGDLEADGKPWEASIQTLAADPDPDVRRGAEWALKSIARKPKKKARRKRRP